MKTSLTVIGILLFLNTLAQKRTTITDPDIKFSLEIPRKWKTQNDEYYFHVFNPKWENSQLTLTYYNENTPRELGEIVDTRLTFSYPEIPGFKHRDTHELQIDGVTAYRVDYDSKSEGLKMKNSEYIFLKEGQVWYVLIAIPKENVEDQFPIFQKIAESLQCEYNY